MVGIFDPKGDAVAVNGAKERTGFKHEWNFCCVSLFPLPIKNRNLERAEMFVIIAEGGIRRQLYEFYKTVTIIPNTGKLLRHLSLGARVFIDVVSVGNSRVTQGLGSTFCCHGLVCTVSVVKLHPAVDVRP